MNVDGATSFLQSIVLGFRTFAVGLWGWANQTIEIPSFTIPFTGVTLGGISFPLVGLAVGSTAITLLGVVLVLHIIHLVNVVAG